MASIISLSNVTVLGSRERKPILDGFDLFIEKGELALIVGAGGSGKSTIFRLLTGDEKPESGEVMVRDINVPMLSGLKLARYRRELGIVAQDSALLDDRTVEAHLSVPLEIEGIRAERRRVRVESILERFELSSERKKLPNSLSRSERQRTAIAAAVVREPMVLLADEPAAHLDFDGSGEMARLLLHENLRGMTILIATSDEHFASRFPESSIRRMERMKIGIEK